MGIENTEKKEPSKKRLSLDTPKAARTSLCRLMRLRLNNKIDSVLFRDLVYAFNVLLGIDKHITESELCKRIDDLEKKLGVINENES